MRPKRPNPSKGNSLFSKLKNIQWNQKTVAIILGIIFSFLLLVFIYFIQAPEFPDDIPSPDNVKKETLTYQSQQKFFDQYSSFIRKRHGSLLVNKEVNRVVSAQNKEISPYVIYLMEFTLLDEELFFSITNKYIKKLGFLLKIRKNDPTQKVSKNSYAYEIDFLNKGILWVRINIRYGGLHGKSNRSVESRNYLDLLNGGEERTFSKPTSIAGEINNPQLVIIIDDIGNNKHSLTRLLGLGFDITYAIMPQLAASEETAQIIHNAGKDIMLHLPMEPKDWPKFNPGPGALMLGDDYETLRNTLIQNFQTVPFAIGVNNHMGSAFTQYQEGMEFVMEALSERGLFFLDSKTAPGRVGKNAARKFDVKFLERNIFLDNVQDHNAITTQLYKGVRIAKAGGVAILIGHPYVETYEVLAEQLPLLEEQGIRVVGIHSLIRSR